MNPWLILLAIALLVIGTLFGCSKPLANRMLLWPSTGVIEVNQAESRHVPTPAGPMQVWVGGPAEPSAFVLRLEGNAGRAERSIDMATRRWSERDAQVWAMNWPGYGDSEGPATLDRLVIAAEGVWADLADQAAGRPIYLDADSMGTTVALHLAATAEPKPAGVVLKNPPPLRQLILGRFGWWNLWLGAGPVAMGVPRELDSLANAENVTAPVVILTAERDGLVLPRYQRRIFDALAGPKVQVIFKDADHNTPIDRATEEALREAIGDALD